MEKHMTTSCRKTWPRHDLKECAEVGNIFTFLPAPAAGGEKSKYCVSYWPGVVWAHWPPSPSSRVCCPSGGAPAQLWRGRGGDTPRSAPCVSLRSWSLLALQSQVDPAPCYSGHHWPEWRCCRMPRWARNMFPLIYSLLTQRILTSDWETSHHVKLLLDPTLLNMATWVSERYQRCYDDLPVVFPLLLLQLLLWVTE